MKDKYINMIEVQKPVQIEKENAAQQIKSFSEDDRGMGTVEVILIIVVLVGLVIIFRDQITEIVSSLFSKVTTNVNKL